jgi:hypothetical protein
MICYRDMTFCEGDGCAKFGKDCTRSLTLTVQEHAQHVGLPIARFANPKAQKCYTYRGKPGCRFCGGTGRVSYTAGGSTKLDECGCINR